jgi:hypothetical protein
MMRIYVYIGKIITLKEHKIARQAKITEQGLEFKMVKYLNDL